MASSALTLNSQNPLPEDLPKLLHNPKTPWQISPALFQKMAKQFQVDSAAGKKFVAIELTNQDPEFAFVYHYFQHQKPPHYAIKKILCLHNPSQTKMFEGSFDGMEAAAKTFAPGWKEEEPKAHRTKTMERWKKSAAVFSPFQIPSTNRVDIFTRTKIIPLWHGSKHVESICNIGFTFFGKHHLFDKAAKAGAQASTDIGYFGSGIYFTNSAHYASMYNSGTLVLSWVSMREPFPVVSDFPIPKKGSDMKKLEGKHAYQNYNAHYIPVTSTDPKEPDNMVYHPCHQTEQPAWDEYVVFEKSQALPRFVVELGVDLPKTVSLLMGNSSEKTVKIFIAKLEQLLEHPNLKEDQELAELITKKLDSLLDLDSESPIPNGEIGFYNRIIRLIDPTGKVNSTYLNLIKQRQESTTTVSSKISAKEPPQSLAKVVKKQESAATSPAAGNLGINHKTGYAYPSATTAAEPIFDNSLQKILDKYTLKSDKNIYDSEGRTAIHKAAIEGRVDAFSLTCLSSDLINEQDIHGYTPLILAAYYGHASLCNLLLRAPKCKLDAVDKQGKNVLHTAAEVGNVDIIKMCIAANKHLLESKTHYGYTPLLVAAYNGKKKACEVLKNLGADMEATDESGQKIIHIAAMAENPEVLEWLLQDKKWLAATDGSGNFPLHTAAYYGQAKACDLLVKARCIINVANWDGKTALDLANEQGKEAVVKFLKIQGLDLFPNVAKILDKGPLLPIKTLQDILKPATPVPGPIGQQKQKEIAAANVIPDKIDENGNTELHLALAHSDLTAVKLLIITKKHLINLKNNNGFTPLHVAALKGGKVFCEMLIAAGANITDVDKYGRNVIHFAVDGSSEVIDLFKAQNKLIESYVPVYGTPLQLAACRGNLDAIKRLIAVGANVDAKHGKQGTALDVAEQAKQDAATSLLRHIMYAPPENI